MLLQLWTRARRELGLSTEEFFALTPRQFDALQEYRSIAERTAEIQMAELIAMVANTGFRSYKTARKATEFMPSKAHEHRAPQAGRRTKKELQRRAKQIQSAFNTFWGPTE